METIQLPESELAEMKLFYQEEYDKAVKRLQHIKTMLVRLGADTQAIDHAASGSGKGTAVKSASTPASSPKRKRKSKRKSKWELLVMKRLRQLDRPVTYDELTQEIMTFSKLPAEKLKSTKQAVVNVIFRLRNRDGKLDTFSIGTREKYIALKNWFDQPGVIKKEYAGKIENKRPAKKTGSARPGRPKKKA
jgi:hypothetical protein